MPITPNPHFAHCSTIFWQIPNRYPGNQKTSRFEYTILYCITPTDRIKVFSLFMVQDIRYFGKKEALRYRRSLAVRDPSKNWSRLLRGCSTAISKSSLTILFKKDSDRTFSPHELDLPYTAKMSKTIHPTTYDFKNAIHSNPLNRCSKNVYCICGAHQI